MREIDAINPGLPVPPLRREAGNGGQPRGQRPTTERRPRPQAGVVTDDLGMRRNEDVPLIDEFA